MYSEIPEDIANHFFYDETSSTGICRVRDGKVAGTRAMNKYGNPKSIHVSFRGKYYKVHRIIWVLVHGSINNSLQIDHLDGDPFNNKISNLECKTQADNLRNQRKGLKNTSGHLGISHYKYKGEVTAFIAKWKDENGSNRGKSFSIREFGRDTALEMALAYRREQLLRLKTLGFNYTDRHIGGDDAFCS